MLVKCPNCPTVRELARDRGSLCRPCAAQKRRDELNTRGLEHRIHIDPNGKTCSQYLRVCECGDSKWVGYIPLEGQECRKCSSSKLGKAMAKNNIKPEHEKVRYAHKCTDCGETRYLAASKKYRKTSLCGTCSSRARGLANKKEEEEPVRRFRICHNCGDTKEVKTVSQAKAKLCRKCSNSQIDYTARSAKSVATRAKTQKPKIKKPRKVYAKKVSEQTIEAEKKRNQEHKAAIQEAKKDVKVPKQKLSNEDMIAKFLEKSQPSVKLDEGPMPYLTPIATLGVSA